MKVDKLSNSNLMKINQKLSDSSEEKKNKTSFTNMLKQSLQKTNNLQHQANQASQDLALGKADSVHEVMIAAQKAKISLDLTTEVRNKVVDAYKEIMRIQV
ncbi:flagellar hook-basal body complex protein FliE [Halanaerocella petrolearia]